VPKEILVNTQVLSFYNFPRFIKEKISASVECLEDEHFEFDTCKVRVEERFNSVLSEDIVCALGAMLYYLSETQRGGLERLREIEVYSENQFMGLDTNSRRNLELCETMRSKEKRGSLLWVLDKTRTAMGKRLMRSSIEQPLINLSQITRRLNAVDELYKNEELRDNLFDSLGGIFDLERIMTRIVYGSANGRELRSLYSALLQIPKLKSILKNTQSSLLKALYSELDELSDVFDSCTEQQIRIIVEIIKATKISFDKFGTP